MSVEEDVLKVKIKQQDIELNSLIERLNELIWLANNKWLDVDPLEILELKIRYNDKINKFMKNNIKDLEDLQYKSLSKYLS